MLNRELFRGLNDVRHVIHLWRLDSTSSDGLAPWTISPQLRFGLIMFCRTPRHWSLHVTILARTPNSFIRGGRDHLFLFGTAI